MHIFPIPNTIKKRNCKVDIDISILSVIDSLIPIEKG
jgi:hypothetical protein